MQISDWELLPGGVIRGRSDKLLGIDAPDKYAINVPLRDVTQGDFLLCPTSIQQLRRARCEKMPTDIFLT